MTDAKILHGIRQANDRDAAIQAQRALAGAVLLAISELEPSETVYLTGVLSTEARDEGLVLTIHGAGNPRAYRLTLPFQWIDQVHAEIHANPEPTETETA